METVSINVLINNQKNLFHFRKNSIGDKGVTKQIFANHDYDISGWAQGRRLIEYHENISKNHNSLIVDAGANIGASVLYFARKFYNSFVFAIEPDEINYNFLTKNSENLNCFNFLGAVASEDGELLFFDPGHSDWGFRTKKMRRMKNMARRKLVPYALPLSSVIQL